MENIMTVVWLGAAILFAIAEAATMGLVSIWFAAGSLIAMLASIFGAPLGVQILLFLIASAAILYLARKLGTGRFNQQRQRTNADRVVGMEAMVVETVDNALPSGQIRVDGQIWTARSISGVVIPKDTCVVIKEIAGVKAMVDPRE